MNQKVKVFLDNARKNELKNRNKHLILLGLTDDEKTERKYLNYYSEGQEFDAKKQMYYRDYPVAVAVTDDEYAEICKYAGKVESDNSDVYEVNSSEKTLSTIATVVLWIGIIGSVILFISGLTCIDSYSTQELGYSLLIAIIPLLTSSIITWAILKVLCNISNNLRDINQKTK